MYEREKERKKERERQRDMDSNDWVSKYIEGKKEVKKKKCLTTYDLRTDQ